MNESEDLEVQGRISSVKELYDQYSPVLFSTIKTVISDNTQAEEVLVEVFVEMHNDQQNLNLKQDNFSRKLLQRARFKAMEKLLATHQTFFGDSVLENLSNGEKIVFALFQFRKYSVSEIVNVFHLRQDLVENLLQSAHSKICK